MNDVVDFLALCDVGNDPDGEVLGVLVHVHNDLLNAHLDRVLQLTQVLFFVVNLAQRELESIGVQNVKVLSFPQLLHDFLLLYDVLSRHLTRI